MRFPTRPAAVILATAAVAAAAVAPRATLAQTHATAQTAPTTEAARDPMLQTLGDAAASVVAGEGFGQTADRLTADAAGRVKKDLDEPHDDFAKLVTQFRTAWHERYDEDFDAGHAADALAAKHVGRVEKDGEAHARVAFARSGELSPYAVELVQDGRAWRVELPKAANGDTLVVHAMHALRVLLNRQDDWPKDGPAGYAMADAALLYPFHADAAGASDHPRPATRAAERPKPAAPAVNRPKPAAHR